MKVLVTGGRYYTDKVRVFAELDKIHAARSSTVEHLIRMESASGSTLDAGARENEFKEGERR